jgi:hypothetical protein
MHWLIDLAVTKRHATKPIAAGQTQVANARKRRRVPIADSGDRRHTQQVWSLTCYTHVELWSGDVLSIKPFDGDSGSFIVLVKDEQQLDMTGDRK